MFFSTVLCQNARKAVNTWFIIVNGLRRSHDQQIKSKSKTEQYELKSCDNFALSVHHCGTSPQAYSSFQHPVKHTIVFHYLSAVLISTASLWLRVHEQTAPNVHRHECECRPKQQVQQFHQDAGDGGGPGHQLPDLCITGQEDSDRLTHHVCSRTYIFARLYLD